MIENPLEYYFLYNMHPFNNFVRANLDELNRMGTDSENLNLLLEPWHGRIVDFERWVMTFNTEQDKMFFLLRWS